MRIALFQPDIPQNTGTILRLGACLGVPVDIIEPCGFTFSEKSLRRSAMDYAAQADFSRHNGWTDFLTARPADSRLILLTTRARTTYTRFCFRKTDTLLLGRESAGVPQDVHDAADERIRVPMAENMRSLNVAVAAAMVLGEALRQTGGFPGAAAETYQMSSKTEGAEE